jgi:FkbM family methyltransferase
MLSLFAVLKRGLAALWSLTSVFFYLRPGFRTKMELFRALFFLKTQNKKDKKEIIQMSFFNHVFSIRNASEVQFMLRELWLNQPYWIKRQAPFKKIADVGSNQGFSMFYFKQRFPEAEIHGFEPDESNFQLLQTNVLQFKGSHDRISQTAAWNKVTLLEFSGNENVPSTNRKFSEVVHEENSKGVKAFDFGRWVKMCTYDLIKIDVEGAESKILESLEANHAFGASKIWMIEFHTHLHGEELMHRAAEMFQRAGFGFIKRGIIGVFYENSMKPFL